jgi:dihydroxyacetone kinase-like predicted kinase
LARTPSQLPRLAQAGVVDAGGAGYVLLLESLERVVTGDVLAESLAGEDPLRRRPGWTQPATPVRRGGDLEPGGPAYEVMYLLSTPPTRRSRC